MLVGGRAGKKAINYVNTLYVIRHTWKPDPHSLLTVLAGVSSLRPDRRAVCLATYGQSDAAAVKTLPTTTESTEAG